MDIKIFAEVLRPSSPTIPMWHGGTLVLQLGDEYIDAKFKEYRRRA